MPNDKKNKRQRSPRRSYATYDISVMKLAVHAVIVNKLSHKRAAKEYDIPRSSLIRYLQKVQTEGNGVERHIGRPCVLSGDQENDLSLVIQNMESRLFGLTLTDVRKVVYKYCVKHEVSNNFSEKSAMAGRVWMEGFRRRHPELSLRKPEAVSAQRASGFNRVKVNRFYEVLESIVFTSDGKCIVPPESIYNADESGYTIVQKPHKVMAKTGKKNVGQITSGERGKTITTVCCMSAAGQYVPPLFIFPRKNMKASLTNNAPPGSIGTCTPSGWINEEKFTMWFKHFIKTVQPQVRESPTLLIFDGHASHVRNLDVIEEARQNNVVLLCLPSHCTHKLQPLDVSFFKAMNWQYDEEIRNWMREHDGRRCTEFEVAGIFSAAYAKAATMKNAISGFQKCGIAPLRKDLFTDEDFLSADFTDQPNPVPATDMPMVTHAVSNSPVVQDSVLTSNPSTSMETPNVVLIPSTSDTVEPMLIVSDEPVPLSSVRAQTDAEGNTETVTHAVSDSPLLQADILTSTSSAADFVLMPSIADIVVPVPIIIDDPLPSSSADAQPDQLDLSSFSQLIAVPKQLRMQSSPPLIIRKRKVAHAEIITTSPYKNELKNKKLEVQKKLDRKGIRQKKTKVLSSKPRSSLNDNTTLGPVPEESLKSKAGCKGQRNSRCKNGRPKSQTQKEKKNSRPRAKQVKDTADHTPCLYCTGPYSESTEGWVQCTGPCKLWAHNSCAGVNSSGGTSFMCELCK
jgi:hypothetical protein